MEKRVHCHCCPEPLPQVSESVFSLTRRTFMAGAAAGSAILGGLSFSAVAEGFAADTAPLPKPRVPLIVKPILVHDLPVRREGVSWRNWGGIDSKETAQQEVVNITKELAGIKADADFPVEFLEVTAVTNMDHMKEHPDVAKADLLIVYGAGAGIDPLKNFEKDAIIFQRWKSGPVYLQYEIVSPRFLRQHTDTQKVPHILPEDVVTDSLDELTWRLRSLCGVKNTRNTKIMTIGGAAAWAQPAGVVPALVEKIWGFQYHDISYPELGKLIEAAQKNDKAVALAKKRADEYLKIPNTTLETGKEFVEKCFLLDQVFRALMKEADCKNMTINACMGTIMEVSKTAACMTLSTLNDDGYLAFCESDFVVIPSGVLLANICGKPVFLNDPTYPNDQIITCAHCTGPRKMDGKNYEPTRIVTHFESDYGAAPKVAYRNGMVCTNIAPDFQSQRWLGLLAEVVDAPFKPICRTQIDIRYKVPSSLVAERMPGFHWMFSYGDYMKELGYALRRVGIQWDTLGER